MRAYVNAGLDKGLSNVGISAGVFAIGGKLDTDVIARHKKAHWTRPVSPDAPRPTKRDLALTLRDKVAEGVDQGTLDVFDPEVQPVLKTGLQAEALLDKRAARSDGQKAAIQIAVLLAGGPGGLYAPPELTDGSEEDDVIEGHAVEVE
ncbi:MAG TPA: hypothetical protein VFI40_04730 [Nocardioides sp.]|nr:hypothetical protein [Nocardioides sp.]